MSSQLLLWLGFGVFVVGMLVLDLGVFHRKSHEQSLRSAAVWTVIWVVLALLFNAGILLMRGSQPALEFLTGYIIEWSLSMDNVFVFAVLFTCFGVPRQYQHHVLFWGILGAIVMRLSFILVGAALLERFHWVMYIFGAMVLFAGIKMFRHGPEDIHPERNPILKFAARHLRCTAAFVNDRFFVRRDGVLLATPLFLVLVAVEATDLVFAVDSVPAIFAITRDPFIVFTSNVFAILGLRALYFLLAGVMGMFRYLSEGLAIILCFIGLKMLLTDVVHIPIGLSLGIVLGILAIAVIASLIVARRDNVPGLACEIAHADLPACAVQTEPESGDAPPERTSDPR